MKRLFFLLVWLIPAFRLHAQETPADPVTEGLQYGTTRDSSIRINIYPNPAFGTFYIETKNIFPDAYTLRIFDADQKQVVEMRVFDETTGITLPPGNYTVLILAKNDVYDRKVIVK